MCGRFSAPAEGWQQAYPIDQDNTLDHVQSFNVKPTQQVSIIHRADGLIADHARWWFVPHWFRDVDKDWKQATFNARVETADQKPTFRTAWKDQRCAIPFQGYYEWTGSKGAKQPWYITAQTNAPCLFFAGLYSRRDSGLTTTILTREALPQTEHIHHRSPIILTSDQVLPWIKGEASSTEAKNALGLGWDGRMQFHKVSPFGRDDDGEALIEA